MTSIKNCRIEDLKANSRSSLAMGPFGSRITTDNFVAEGVPVIRGANLSKGRFNNEDFVFLTNEKADELQTSNAYPGDLVFTHRGTLGQVGIIPANSIYRRYVISQSQMKLTCNPQMADPLYLYYYFVSPMGQQELLSNTTTTGVPAIAQPLTTLRNLEVPLPPLPVQREIAQILGAFDDKIELNRRMNETLEAMARALFKCWFVDFEPVRIKQAARERGEDPNAALSRPPSEGGLGLAPDIASLFPDCFVDSELGEIPEGWEVAMLSDLCEINPVRRLRSGKAAPYLEMKNMPIRGHRPLGWVNREFTSGIKFINGDTLLARITPCLENGKTAFVDFLADGQTGWGSTEYIVLRTKPPFVPVYGYLLARSPQFRDFAIQQMTGSSGRQRIPADSLTSYLVVKPSDEVALALGTQITLLFQAIRSNDEVMRTSSQLRDLILPELLSGVLHCTFNDAMAF